MLKIVDAKAPIAPVLNRPLTCEQEIWRRPTFTDKGSNSSFLNEITILSFHLNWTFHILSGSLGYYNVENTNRKLDLEGVFGTIGATSRDDFTAVKKGNYKNCASAIFYLFVIGLLKNARTPEMLKP